MSMLFKLAGTAALALALATLVPSAGAADLDKLAPADAEAVLAIDVQSMRAAKAFKKTGEAILKQAFKTSGPRAFLQATGLDPLKDFTRVTVTLSALAVDPKAAAGRGLKVNLIARGDFDVARLQKAIEDAGAKAGNQFKLVRDGGRTYYTLPSGPGELVTVTFVGKEAVVLGNDADFVKAIVAGEKVEATAAARLLRGATGKVGGDATAFAALALPEAWKERLAAVEVPNPFGGGKASTPLKEIAPRLESVSAAITAGEALDLAVTVHTADAETAKVLQQLSGLGLLLLRQVGATNPQSRPLVDRLLKEVKSSADGTAFTVKARLTEDVLGILLSGGD